jgi:cytochrome c oxidase subunit 2
MVVLMKYGLCLILLAAIPVAGQEAPARKPDRRVNITAERFTFSPSRIKVKQGQEVEFIVTSEDTSHGFRIPAAGIDAEVPQQGKGELRVRFIAREKGRFAFECSRPCGAGHNLMRGEIVVE